MAIYHCSLKVFSRSKGHSAVAAAAYRSGCQLYDERIQKTHRYDKRSGVAETFILLPENTSSDYQSRAVLWNAVEEAEKRKNSCVAREIILALPHELSNAERLSLTRDIALYLMERYRVAVDSAIHAPTEGDGHDDRNHHAHILFSTRELTSEGFGKKTRILDDKVTGKIETEIIREVWETLANDALKRAGFSDIQIDRRSLEDQGVDRIPETHIGNSAKHTDTHSQKLSDEDDSESTEGEEEGDGDQSGGGGASDSFSPSLDIEPAELNALAEKEDTRAKHDRGSRADFVEEIKALNAVRAGFSEIPLEDQITNIDKLMAKLDARVNHLERLQERSSLSSVLKRSMSKLLELSAATILNRQESQLLVRLSGEEKEARAVRQKKRYGRTYRAGLHQQIKEMKSNIETLKTKSQEYNRYKSFVEKIEKHSLHERRSLENQTVKSKSITNEESSLKLALKASMAREQIPLKYRAKVGDKLTSLKVKAHRVNTDIRNTQSNTQKTTHSSETKTPFENNNIQGFNEGKNALKLGSDAKISSQKSRAVFNFNAEINPKVKSDPNPSYKQKIKNFDPIKTHQAQKENQATKPTKSERSPWITPATVKSKPLMDDIARKMAQERRAQPPPKQEKQHDRSTMKGQFNASVSEKFTTNEAHREKTRAEAKTKRSQVPPEYRAKPYPPEHDKEPKDKPQGQGFKSKVQSTFNDARDAVKSKWEKFKAGEQQQPVPEEATEKPRPKMSAGFNKARFEGVDVEDNPTHSVNDDLDIGSPS